MKCKSFYLFFLVSLMITVTSINVNGLRNINKLKELKYTYRSHIICIRKLIGMMISERSKGGMEGRNIL